MTASEHPSHEKLRQYRVKSLRPAELLSVNEHIVSCVACRDWLGCAGDPGVEISLGSEETWADEDLVYQQLSAYVDDELSVTERRLVEEHLDRCLLCAREVIDLQSLKAKLDLAQHGSEMGIPVQIPRTPEPTPSRSGSYRFPALATAAAAGLLLVGVLVVPLWRQNRSLREQVIRLEGAISATRKESDADINDLRKRIDDLASSHDNRTGLGGTLAPEGGFTLHDGDRLVGLGPDGTLVGFESLPGTLQAPLLAALRSSKVRTPSLDSLGDGRSVLMGTHSSTPFSVLSPVGVVVEESRPVLSWASIQPVASYVVIIKDIDSGRQITSAPTHATRWRVDRDLVRGNTYRWEVEATRPDGSSILAPTPPASAASFRVLAESQESAIREARRLYPASHLLLGTLYADAGLIKEAKKELQAVVAANPDSIRARRLLSSLKSAPSNHRGD